ncbi:hypothetical protein BGAL_0389g00080 [Botrytis galanthina]|uniref:RING-type domain-containing protein n=1 Tax=Botrytis galanthina TaxID=278940 RepID=A0A4S8QXQ3_9HELO|nr:hypothetical protein BGAL_0389g00080 [Botrytis galanthina]
MYDITSTTGIGIGYLKSLFGKANNNRLEMNPRNRKIERNPLADFIAIFIFSLIILITLLYQLQNFLLNPQSLQPKTTHPNTQDSTPNELITPNPLALHEYLEPPQANQQEVMNYFNPRFQGIPDLQHLRIQVRENMDAIFEGAVLPWPEIMERGFGYTTMAEIDREVGLQRRQGGGRGGAEQDGNANGASPRDKGDTPGWMLALFEHGHGHGNAETSTPKKKEEDKSTCPICTDELPPKAAIAKPCKHRFCTTCLEDWMEHLRGMEMGKGKGQKIRCPVCGVGIRRVRRGGGLMDRVDQALRRGIMYM